MQMRDVLGTFFNDDPFSGLYPADGQPACAPGRLERLHQEEVRQQHHQII
jgi:hypothetical protein